MTQWPGNGRRPLLGEIAILGRLASHVASARQDRAPSWCSMKPEPAHTMSNRLYVGNLSYSTSQATLETTFASCGEVREVSMPTDRESGQPRGFAFVTMGSGQAADAAISQLNGSMLDGRSLKVNEAQERAPRGGGGRGNRY